MLRRISLVILNPFAYFLKDTRGTPVDSGHTGKRPGRYGIFKTDLTQTTTATAKRASPNETVTERSALCTSVIS